MTPEPTIERRHSDADARPPRVRRSIARIFFGTTEQRVEAVAIAVVGGTLMTGGFGTVLGVVFGAVTFGLVANAVFFIPAIDGSYYRVFVGVVLLIAVFLNESVRKRITGGI